MKHLIEFAQGGPLHSHNVCLLVRYDETRGWYIARKHVHQAGSNPIAYLYGEPRPDKITALRLIREAGGSVSDEMPIIQVLTEGEAEAIFSLYD